MFQQKSLQSLVESGIDFKKSSKGWLEGKCRICNDYKSRAGFKFNDNKITYNCFNCHMSASYEEYTGDISNKFKSILKAYGFDLTEVQSIVNLAFFNNSHKEIIKLADLTAINTATPTVELPKNTFKLGSNAAIGQFSEYNTKIMNYLLSRKVDIGKYPFYFSMQDRFIGKVIIPYFRNGQLIYWQARSVTGANSRYDNSYGNRTAVMFNFDEISRYSNIPLFVSEGVFDAMMFNGISIVGSSLSAAQIELLKRSTRRLIFVIDKDTNGKHLAHEAIKHGWDITFVPDGSADINQSVQKFGHSWTAQELMKNIPPDKDAQRLSINLHCV